MKVHKITLLVVDYDDIGADEAKVVLENQRYPNYCMYPRVMETETREVEWSDEHPLNQNDTERAAFRKLFGS